MPTMTGGVGQQTDNHVPVITDSDHLEINVNSEKPAKAHSAIHTLGAFVPACPQCSAVYYAVRVCSNHHMCMHLPTIGWCITSLYC